MKYFAVSDIHSYYTPLQRALQGAGFDVENPDHKLIICGDLMDRGSESYELQEYILKLLEKDKVILVRGNHEDLALELIENFEKKYSSNISGCHHYWNRTIHTLLDLTGLDFEDLVFHPQTFVEKAKNTAFVKDIIPKMVDYYETDNYVFVHGWIPSKKRSPNKDWRLGNWNEARWFNGMEKHYLGNFVPGKTVVCGHWHTSWGYSVLLKKGSEWREDACFEPYIQKGIIAIDGCTNHTGKVNCVIIED